MTRAFVNWSGLSFTPAQWAEPADESEVCALVRRARDLGVPIRPVGSGHSSSPLVRTDGILLGLDRLAGVLSDDGRLATAAADAALTLDFYYEDAEPVGPYRILVGARRVRHVRVNDLIDPEAVRLDRPYGCVLRSPVPVVVQFLRLPGVVALTGTMAYPG
ncbi:sensory rhodopsin transducer [Micromonospora sp. NPDC050980]|uniref:sensory rhodopsin transducer n=1 Tax=Micromonospora sp. NPDC050980 TaxID=3155161 RepID=UPI0033CB5B39